MTQNASGLLPPAAGTGGLGLAAAGNTEGMLWLMVMGGTLMLLALALVAIPQIGWGALQELRDRRINPYTPEPNTTSRQRGVSRKLLGGALRAPSSAIKGTWRILRH